MLILPLTVLDFHSFSCIELKMYPIMLFMYLVRAHGHRWVLENSHEVTRRTLQKGMANLHVTLLASLLAHVGIHTVAMRRRNQWIVQVGVTLVQSYLDRMAVLSLPCVHFNF